MLRSNVSVRTRSRPRVAGRQQMHEIAQHPELVVRLVECAKRLRVPVQVRDDEDLHRVLRYQTTSPWAMESASTAGPQ